MSARATQIALAAWLSAAWAADLAAQEVPPGRVRRTAEQKAADREAKVKAVARLRESTKQFLEARRAATASASATATVAAPTLVAPAVDQAERAAATKLRQSALASRTPFVEPPVIRSKDGVLRAHLVIDYAENTLHTPDGDVALFLRSYNGGLVGPTLRARPGDLLKITLENRLEPDDESSDQMNTFHGDNTTNLHTHGLHVSPAGNSDNVLLELPGGTRFEYEIKIPEDHPAGTFWYHAHKHGSVSLQVASGMLGALIVEGGVDRLETIAAMKERLFVLEQIPFIIPEGGTVGVVESKYADQLFGFGDWQKLKTADPRHRTTVNGVGVPELRMRPGEVQRWRFVMGGIRETVSLQLIPGDGKGGPVPLYELAADGLPLGKLERQTDPAQLQLWPGYRSDLLVQAPHTPGTYLLIDAPSAATSSVDLVAEQEAYIAKVVVEGPPVAMPLPTDDDLAPFRLPSIRDDEIQGSQKAEFALGKNGGPNTVNGEPYSADRTLHLPLGEKQKWVLKADVPHVFHIHVNPFEIVKLEDGSGNPVAFSRRWRDSIVVRPGQVTTFYTQYRRYIGAFVLHCHILDHEDLGMMEQLAIDPPGPAPHAMPAGGGGGGGGGGHNGTPAGPAAPAAKPAHGDR